MNSILEQTLTTYQVHPSTPELPTAQELDSDLQA